MARVEKFKFEGGRELDAALGQLTKAAGLGVLRRVLLKVAQPIADTAQALAPEDKGVLQDRISINTRLTKRQARLNRKSDEKTSAEIHIGPPGSSDISRMVEEGTADAPAQPYMRPAWETKRSGALDGIRTDLRAEIDLAAARAARKALRATRG